MKAFGFRPARHEGKITGLAAYGDPDACHSECKDIAAALQRVLEEEVLKMVQDALSMTGIPDLVLAGGVFSNVKLNQRIREDSGARQVYIHPGMGDDGLMVGAAYLGLRELANRRDVPFQREFMKTVYLGPSFAEDKIRLAAHRHGVQARRSANIEDEIAEHLSEGRIVGRFAGRMEYGPRALGNRTILADPRDNRINDWLNKRLKRTEFMPFAPSILEEDASRYFKGWGKDHVAARFMTVTYDVFPEVRDTCRAVVHVDGTCRPQVVRAEDNPSYHRILSAYKRRTGLPLTVNTSFNIHEEPIVCSPSDALRAFASGAVDVLAMENVIVRK